MSDIEKTIIHTLVEQTGVMPSDVSLTTNLHEDLLIDSLDLVEVAMAIEDHFGIDLPDDEFGDAKTVADIVALVTRITGEA